MRLERTVESTATPEQVFAYLADFTHTEQWDPGTVTTTRVSGDGGVGTVYRNVSSFNGRETELTYEVQRYESPRLIQLRGTNKTVTAVDTMTIAPLGEGSTVTYTADFEFQGLAKLAVPFLGRAMKKLGDEAQAGLRQALAGLEAPAGEG